MTNSMGANRWAFQGWWVLHSDRPTCIVIVLEGTVSLSMFLLHFTE